MPTIGQPGTNKCVCTRCQHVLRAPHAVQISEAGIALDQLDRSRQLAGAVSAGTVPAPSATALDGWELRRRNRELGRKLRHDLGHLRTRTTSANPVANRFALPENIFHDLPLGAAAATYPPSQLESSPRSSAVSRRSEGGQFIAWFTALCGASVLGVGLGTVSWSLSADRYEIWNLAVGLTMIGQGLLIFGLVLIAARLWRNSRYASTKLIDVHAQLGQLQSTADALTMMRSGAPAFYAELVRGASPQMLLANLKGQLDQLATRVGNDF
jgi:hypothetical protein